MSNFLRCVSDKVEGRKQVLEDTARRRANVYIVSQDCLYVNEAREARRVLRHQN